MTITPDRKTLAMIAAVRLLPPVYGKQPGCKGSCERHYPESKVNPRAIEDKTGWKTCRKCKFWAKTEDNRCRCCNTQLATRAYPK